MGFQPSDHAAELRERVLDGAGQGSHLHAALAALVDHPLWRRPEGARDQGDAMLEEQLDQALLAVVAERDRLLEGRVGGQRRNTVLLEQVVEELDVLLGDLARAFRPAPRTVLAPCEFLRQQQIHAVGFVADLVFDPLELGADACLRLAGDAEHAQSTGLGDGGRHVSAMGEGENGKFETEFLSECGVHESFLQVGSSSSGPEVWGG